MSNRIPQHVDAETWDGVPVIEKFVVTSRGFAAQYTWCRESDHTECPRFWCRTLCKSGNTYFRRGKYDEK